VTSDEEYVRVFELGRAGLNQGVAALTAGINTQGPEGSEAYVVFNSLGWKRSAVVQLPVHDGLDRYAVNEEGQRLRMDREEHTISILVNDIPALGYKTIWLVPENMRETNVREVTSLAGQRAFNDTWDTAFYHAEFNERGEITRLWDKAAEREMLKPGERGNQFHFFHDRPTLWDAWDIDSRYEEQVAGEVELLEKKLVLAGTTKDVLRFRWKLHQSVITQDIVFYHESRRIDFQTQVSWNENHKLLKVGFPIDVVTSKATYEIPFGALERPTHRNTSWEQAQYEVCGHRFADVSEYGYGVSLLNDCKYGYDVQGSTIRLSLLRAPKWPDRTADLGEHEFTYSLYPHEGDWRNAHTVRHAAELNHEVTVQHAEQSAGRRPATGAWINFDSSHVVLDTVKPAEAGEGTVLRFYESSGKREQVTLQWQHAFEQAYLSNALEEPGEPLDMTNGQITLTFAPYEIKTVLLR